MPNIASQILLQIVFILLNAFFAGSEIAFLSLSQIKLSKKAEDGDKTAAALLKVVENPNTFLSGIQVAITLSGFLSAAFGTENFSGYLDDFMLGTLHLPLPAGVVSVISTVLVTVIISFFSIAFGEMVPKRIAMQKPMMFAVPALHVLRVVSVVFAPMFALLNVCTNGTLRLMGMKVEAEEGVASEEDLRLMVESSGEQGTIDQDEQEWIENVFDFNDMTASSAMTPEPDVTAFSLDEDPQEILKAIRETGLSRYPVYEDDDVNDICGILNARDFLLNLQEENPRPLKELLRPAYFVPESVHADQLFKDMQAQKQHLAVVVDEYGGTAGVITIEDLLEEIVGDIFDEFDPAEPQELTEMGKGMWRVAGSMRVEEFAEALDFELPEDRDYDTVAGLILSCLPSIPEDGTTPSVEVCGLQFDVQTIEDRKILWAMVHKITPPPQAEDEEAEEKNHRSRQREDEEKDEPRRDKDRKEKDRKERE
ncbi:hemolysin family protein [uncultured Subdoligranulum sp.]|uniref:hemolysin family protein n=1 Tax=uncultured Subdoligranulum sp. TaxID=512298 RepID=UPI0025ED04C5|nr:hemolysin family protein [uncultured Subdoligranulum sp.]